MAVDAPLPFYLSGHGIIRCDLSPSLDNVRLFDQVRSRQAVLKEGRTVRVHHWRACFGWEKLQKTFFLLLLFQGFSRNFFCEMTKLLQDSRFADVTLKTGENEIRNVPLSWPTSSYFVARNGQRNTTTLKFETRCLRSCRKQGNQMSPLCLVSCQSVLLCYVQVIVTTRPNQKPF